MLRFYLLFFVYKTLKIIFTDLNNDGVILSFFNSSIILAQSACVLFGYFITSVSVILSAHVSDDRLDPAL